MFTNSTIPTSHGPSQRAGVVDSPRPAIGEAECRSSSPLRCRRTRVCRTPPVARTLATRAPVACPRSPHPGAHAAWEGSRPDTCRGQTVSPPQPQQSPQPRRRLAPHHQACDASHAPQPRTRGGHPAADRLAHGHVKKGWQTWTGEKLCAAAGDAGEPRERAWACDFDEASTQHIPPVRR